MTPNHPLDRPAWSALTGRQRALARGDARAVRLDPAMGVFLGGADPSDASVAAMAELIANHPGSGVFEAEGSAMDALFPAGVTVANRIVCVQMHCAALSAARTPEDLDILTLGEADAAEMLDLATLTRPGPYRERTHALGDFIGLRRDGRLIAMAGQRLRIDGFIEISAVCTHPDFRGQGLAAALMRLQAERILTAGETPFLHAAHDNAAAIGLYESLGFRARTRIAYTVLTD